MQLVITRAAQKQLRAIPRDDARRLVEALQSVADRHPERLGYVTEIVGRSGAWRARKGNYRAIYRVTKDTIEVLAIGNRKDIYE